MKIVVEMPFDVEGKRGWIYYTESLLRELARIDKDNEYWVFNFFFRNHRAKAETIYCPDAPNFRKVVPRWPESVMNQVEWGWKIPAIETYLKSRGTDVYHAARAPITTKLPVVTTVHDIMYVKHPEHMYPKFKWGWEHCGIPGLKTTTCFITHSEHHKKELVEILGVDERKIRCIPTGANTQIFYPIKDAAKLAEAKERMRLPDRFALMLGPFSRFWCHYDATLHGLKALSKDHPEFKLVMVGDNGSPGAERLKALAEILGIEDRLVWFGRVPGADLLLLFNLALCNIYPAWDTGCSINVLDSMSAGLPVVTGRVSLLPEMLGEAGIWADPHSAAEMEAALRKVVEDEDFRSLSGRICLERAQARRWEDTARATLDVYRGVVR
ncbi:MAG: glycosyltransferase family 4 protein [Elusimicrobia bacterium]|nr:glycosyltransferase family 4 protein [Elusimicrobiota bacterium]